MRLHNFYERKLIVTGALNSLEESKTLLLESEYLIDETRSVVNKFHEKEACQLLQSHRSLTKQAS